ncbi:MAG: chemotaxis protein CheA [Magnetococcales bacterium]|nr:chemotaxis protein CheA [Magnetococcales bacterium]
MNQPDLATTFRVEAGELLTDLEAALLELEEQPDNGELVGRSFRALHTLKGSGGMAGFGEIVRFAHGVESVFDRVRNGTLAVERELLTLALAAKDHLHALLNAGPAGGEELAAETNELLARCQPYLGTTAPAGTSGTTAAPGKAPPKAAAVESFWVRFRPEVNSLVHGSDPLALLEELAEQGEVKACFHDEGIPPLEDLTPERCLGWWDLVFQTGHGEQGIRDVFIFVDEPEVLQVQPLGLGQVRGDDLTRFLDAVKKYNDAEKAREDLLKSIEWVRQERTKRRTESAGAADSASLRVDAHRLDKLVDMVGELVIIQSRLSLSVRGAKDPALSQLAEELERLSDAMRGNALGLRMLPIGVSFNAFKRLVRDLAVQLGKDADFVAEGAETELDKTVIDRLKDPLLHILRNAVDHGLETADERMRSGKSAQGTVKLTATNAGGDVLLTIRDDGRGIDLEKVRAKALARGLLTPEANPSRKELFALLFEPGFSTAEKVSDVSGRGVGMDVVKRSIEGLRGSVEVDSQPGTGSVFSIRLPLTLAIIDGLGVKVGRESFIIPLATVEACQERMSNDGRLVDNIPRNGQLIPCINLRRLLGVPGEPPGFERVLIARVEEMEVGLAVDRVVGRQQAVIKSLGGIYRNLDWISGTTINGDGGIALILDVAQLVRFAYAKSHAVH